MSILDALEVLEECDDVREETDMDFFEIDIEESIPSETSHHKDLWDDLDQINEDDLPFNEDDEIY